MRKTGDSNILGLISVFKVIKVLKIGKAIISQNKALTELRKNVLKARQKLYKTSGILKY